MFFLLLGFYLCDDVIGYFDHQVELYMVIGAFVEVKGEGVMKERISKVDIESVIDLEIDFEGGFAVGWQFENSGGYSNLFNWKSLKYFDVFDVSKAVVSELHVNWSLIGQFKISASLKDTEFVIIIFVGKINWNNFVVLGDSMVLYECGCVIAVDGLIKGWEIMFDKGGVIDIVVFLEGNITYFDFRLD